MSNEEIDPCASKFAHHESSTQHQPAEKKVEEVECPESVRAAEARA
jgi:hypothetical protein